MASKQRRAIHAAISNIPSASVDPRVANYRILALIQKKSMENNITIMNDTNRKIGREDYEEQIDEMEKKLWILMIKSSPPAFRPFRIKKRKWRPYFETMPEEIAEELMEEDAMENDNIIDMEENIKKKEKKKTIKSRLQSFFSSISCFRKQ
ncbi:uncharacterized protein LOC143768455 [Ranitomeya variabilis]|uniref:uncharacterized protein LOC143768455 n=1 Tax=Ranitomeya variabilis TaxID=490064 RepID=UPI0040563945